MLAVLKVAFVAGVVWALGFLTSTISDERLRSAQRRHQAADGLPRSGRRGQAGGARQRLRLACAGVPWGSIALLVAIVAVGCLIDAGFM